MSHLPPREDQVHGVKFVEGDALPAGHDYVMCRTENGSLYCFVRAGLPDDGMPESAQEAIRLLGALPGPNESA